MQGFLGVEINRGTRDMASPLHLSPVKIGAPRCGALPRVATSQIKRLEIEKWVFPGNTRKSLDGKVVGSINMHVCAEFGEDCTSFDVLLALTEVAWVESHATSYMIASFVRGSHFSLRYAASRDCTWN